MFLQLGVVGHFPVEAGEIADAVKHARISVRAVTFFVGQVDELCFVLVFFCVAVRNFFVVSFRKFKTKTALI